MKSEWKQYEGWIEIQGMNCSILLVPRPEHCDRGNYLAQLFAYGPLRRDIDDSDRWPRYYFDLERAKLECEAWLKKRGLYVEDNREMVAEAATAPGAGAVRHVEGEEGRISDSD